MPKAGGQWLAGGLIGLLSGLVGAGGGFISVPFMAWCNVAMHNAVATSAALGFPIAVANAAGYVVSGMSAQALPTGSFGYIWLPALAVIALCSVFMAPIGARIAHRLPHRSVCLGREQVLARAVQAQHFDRAEVPREVAVDVLGHARRRRLHAGHQSGFDGCQRQSQPAQFLPIPTTGYRYGASGYHRRGHLRP
jgi:hypothetical protein